MFKSVLLRKTIILLLVALLASALFTTFAFTLAGKSATYSTQSEQAFSQARSIANFFGNNPGFINDENITDALFSDTSITGRGIFLFDKEGNIIYSPSNPSKTDARFFDMSIDYVKDNMLTDEQNANRYKIITDDKNFLDRILIVVEPVNVNDSIQYYVVSVSSVTENNQTVNNFVNVLLISTLFVAFAMLIPVYLVTRRIVEPINTISNITREYAAGDFTVRANENYKGEVGEIAKSFNYLADQLSKSISDLTIERNRLKEVFDVVTDGIVVVDTNCKPIIVNKTMDTLFDKVQKKNLFTEKLQLIPFDEVWDAFQECMQTSESYDNTMEGPNYAYHIAIFPKYDMDNVTVIGATGFFRDISEELKLERTRKDYVANISHELRTPLQTLRGLVEPLSDGMVKKEEDRMRYYGIILHETMRLSRLIDDMLELSKLQSRTLAFKTFPFDLNQLLMEVETKFMPVMRDAGLNVKVSFNTGELPTVMGNPDRVEQILVILMDNAKKYTPSGGSITIAAEYHEDTDKVFVSVIDTGQGIHEYDINHIFDRFFKADRARGKKGTGLGLAIAKELLTYMGEDITVDSTYGEGTTFTFTLKRVGAQNSWF